MQMCCSHSTGQIYFDDINLDKEYHPWKSYRQSKLANVLFSRELAKRLQGTEILSVLHQAFCSEVNSWRLSDKICPIFGHIAGTGVTTYSLHPGVIRTELGRHLWPSMPLWKRFVYKPLIFFIKSPKEGAQTTIYCAVEESLQNESGLYYRSVNVNLYVEPISA